MKKGKIRRLLSITLLGTMLASSVVQAAPLSDTAENESLEYLAYYPLTEDVQDHSGNEMAQNAELKGTGAEFKDGALYLPGGAASSSAGYVELPKGMFDGQNTLTISVWLKNETGAGDYAAMFFGTGKNSSGYPSQYWLLNPSKGGKMKSVITNSVSAGNPWTTEYGITPTNSSNGISGPTTDSSWAMYTTVITEDSITGYYNNQKIGTVKTSNKVENFGENLLAYIGKSSYPDKFYKGGVKELAIYKNELTEAQVKELYAGEALEMAKENLTIANDSAITDDIQLPTSDGGVKISWSSSNPEILNEKGEITRGEDVEGTQEVTLTATLSVDDYTVTKDFTVLVAEAQTADVPYLAYYPLEKDTKDASGNDRDAELKGQNGIFTDGSLSLPGGASGSDAAYVELPKGMFDGKNTVTISAWLKNQTGSGNYAAMFFGNDKNSNGFPTQYWLLNPANLSGQMKSVITNSVNESAPYNTEYGISPTNSAYGIAGPKTGSDWAKYTTVITENSITGYYNDQKIGTVEITNKVENFGTDLFAYIGKSSYSDMFYKGSVKEVKIYDGAQSYKQVKSDYYNEVLKAAKDGLSIGDTSAVKEDLTLPATLENGVSVSWETSKASVITAEGKVTRPEEGKTSETITLTATLSLNGYTVTKEFEVTVVPWNLDEDLAEAAAQLKLAKVISEDIELPEEGKYGSTITWKSSDDSVLSDAGAIVSRPESGKGNQKVTLTATLSLNGKSVEKPFKIEVMEEFYGYIMSYVTGNNDLTGSLHLAYSTDGANFTALNSNTGILFATIDTNNGNKNLTTGIRFTSPYLFRKADGSFGFTATQSNSKKSIYMYDSEDLLTYTGERMVETNTDIGNPLSPQVVYDSKAGAYRVNWTCNGVKYSNLTEDLTTLEAPQAYDYTEKTTEGIQTIPEGAVTGNVIGVTKAEYDKIINKFTKVTNTGISEVKDVTVKSGEDVELPESVTAYYSDGSTANMGVTWNTDGIDFSKAGTYTVNGTVNQTEYTNPLIEQRADPQIKYDEDTKAYYFTASYPAFYNADNGYDRIILRKADTIQGLSDAEGGLEKEITIWKAPSTGKMARHVWAPEIHKIKGKWYVFFAAGDSGNIWNIRPYVLVCQGDDPYDASSWVQADGTAEIHAATSEESAYFKHMSLDMTYFEHNGKHYVIWADIIGQSALYMQEINPDKPWEGKGKVIMLTTPEYGWERNVERVNEGPTILKHDGKIFIAFSAAGTGPEYCIGLLTADENADLMDPDSWTKTAYPVLTSADVPGEYGPGHNSFTVDENGNAVFVYHARSEECYKNQCQWSSASSLYDPCRHARVKRVHWAADGTPILNMSYEEELNDAYKNVTVQVTVEDNSGEGKELAITENPKNYVGKIGETAEFTVKATGEGLTYKWEYSNANSSKWYASSMEGSKTDTVKVPVQKYRDGQKYRCIVTDKNGKTVTSAVVAVKVAELPAGLAIVSQPVSVNAAKGTMTEFKVQAIGEGLTYQWEYCNASSNKWRTSSMEGNQTDTIKVEAGSWRNGQKYRCVIKDAEGNTLTSDAATLTVTQ